VPRQIAKDDTPRRRRGANARAAAVEADAERGLAMRMLLHSPKDMVAGVLAFAAVSAIIANALFLQAGRHPSPMFGSVVSMPAAAPLSASPLPRPRPVEFTRPADTSPPEPRPAEPKAVDPRAVDLRAVDPRAVDPKPVDHLANLVKATSAPAVAPSNIVRPPAPIPAAHGETTGSSAAASRRVAAVQRALTEYGYGQLKPTGTVGSDTLAAIQKFERERRIPVSGQISDRLVRELATVTGRPIE
jgi:putative peptidoglycan binding protein